MEKKPVGKKWEIPGKNDSICEKYQRKQCYSQCGNYFRFPTSGAEAMALRQTLAAIEILPPSQREMSAKLARKNVLQIKLILSINNI
jgi:hypothetical protein